MEHLDWNKLLDRYLTVGKMDSNEWEKLDDPQKLVINEFKKAFKRLKNKNETIK